MKIFVEFGHPTHAKVCVCHKDFNQLAKLLPFRKAVTVSMEDFLREELFRLKFMIKCFMRKKISHIDHLQNSEYQHQQNHVLPN